MNWLIDQPIYLSVTIFQFINQHFDQSIFLSIFLTIYLTIFLLIIQSTDWREQRFRGRLVLRRFGHSGFSPHPRFLFLRPRGRVGKLSFYSASLQRPVDSVQIRRAFALSIGGRRFHQRGRRRFVWRDDQSGRREIYRWAERQKLGSRYDSFVLRF